MSVSIIIPNYNNSRWLDVCLESCLVQSHLKEIIVVDDQSTDNSWEQLTLYQHKYPDVIKIYKNPSKGGNNARNYGFKQSTGAYIQWLDSDDQLLPGKFEAQISVMEADINIDIVYSDWRRDLYKEGVLKESVEIEYGPYDDFLLELIKDNWTVPCNYLLKRRVAEQLANGFGWNLDTKVGQDREYFNKAAILGAKFQYVPGTFSVYNRWSDKTVSNMAFASRLVESYKLEQDLKKLIIHQEWLAPLKKKNYVKILNAHALTASFYNKNLKIHSDFGIFDVEWKNIHWKIRLILFLKMLFR